MYLKPIAHFFLFSISIIMSSGLKKPVKLTADANKILFVKGLPYKIGSDELYELFGRYGAIQQIRLYVTSTYLNH